MLYDIEVMENFTPWSPNLENLPAPLRPQYRNNLIEQARMYTTCKRTRICLNHSAI